MVWQNEPNTGLFLFATHNDAATDELMRISRRRTAIIVGFLLLTSCGTVMTTDQPQGAPPDAKAIVLRYLKKDPGLAKPGTSSPGPGSLFASVDKLGMIELSAPSPVQHPTFGWTWLACLRTHPADDAASDYALFIGTDSIRDARLSVATDACATQTYEPLGRFNERVKKTDDAKRRRSRGEH